MSSEKAPSTSELFEVASQDKHLQGKLRIVRILDSVQTAITLLGLLLGLTVLGVSANTLSVYNYTKPLPGSFLSLWPQEFNIQPAVALVACSAIITVLHMVALVFPKVQFVCLSYFSHCWYKKPQILTRHHIASHNLNRPSLSLLCPPLHLPCLRSRRRHLLLLRQRLRLRRHVPVLDLPVARGPHVDAAQLGYAVQAEQGGHLPVHPVDSRGSRCAGVERVVAQGEELCGEICQC